MKRDLDNDLCVSLTEAHSGERGGGGRDMRIVKMDFDMKLGTQNVNMGKGWASREPWLELQMSANRLPYGLQLGEYSTECWQQTELNDVQRDQGGTELSAGLTLDPVSSSAEVWQGR